MRVSVRPATIPRVAGAVVALWLCAAGSAWAGGAGDLGTVQTFLDGVCSSVGQSPCPKIPTITQGILEIAGLANARPEAVRYGQNIPAGVAVNAGNPPVPAPTALSPLDLSSLTPLAFISAPTQAAPTQLYDPDANSFSTR